MAKEKSEKNYWPHAIVAIILAMVFACALVVKIAMDNPVEMDTFYMEKYQKVDENINTIIELQKSFDAKFSLTYSSEKFVMNQKNKFTLTLRDKQTQKPVLDANMTVMLSRPETNKENQELLLLKSENGNYTFETFVIDRPGRWQILSKIRVGEFVGYHKTEAYATP